MNWSILKLAAIALPIFVGQAHADSDFVPIGDAIQQVPIFDAHMHYKEPAWSSYTVGRIVELMDRSGVAMGLVSSTPDDGTIMLRDYAPNRIVPELRPYYGRANSSNWTKSDGMETYLEDRLNAYQHEGIGEFHIHRLDTSDEPLFRNLIKMARERDIYLQVHAAAEPIRWLFSLDPEVKIIWAHAGLGESASDVYQLMEDYPTLLADTALREWEIVDAENGLSQDWKRIIFDFQDRLMVGSDTWGTGRWAEYESIIASNRDWLSYLPRNIAEKIAYGNAETYFQRVISMDQIGTR